MAGEFNEKPFATGRVPEPVPVDAPRLPGGSFQPIEIARPVGAVVAKLTPHAGLARLD